MDTRAQATTLTANEIEKVIETFQAAEKSCFPCLKKANTYIQALENVAAQNAS